MEVPLIGIVTGSVTAVLLPDITRLFQEGRKAEALAIWQRSAMKTSLILIPAMWLLFFLAPEVMTVLFSSKYAESALPFRPVPVPPAGPGCHVRGHAQCSRQKRPPALAIGGRRGSSAWFSPWCWCISWATSARWSRSS